MTVPAAPNDGAVRRPLAARVPAVVRVFFTILGRHGITLMAWYLGGDAVHRALLQLAGFVGSYTTLGGLLILPLAVGARLVAYVAMYLTVRPALRMPGSAEPGLRSFVRAVAVAILPFTIFYTAWGLLESDQTAFVRIAMSNALAETGYGVDIDIALGDRGGFLPVGVVPLTILIVAFVIRSVLSHFQSRLPVGVAALGAYAELVWVFMFFTMVAQWLAQLMAWLSTRAGVVWLVELGDAFAISVPPVAMAWEGIIQFVGLAMAALVVPGAWLAIAAVIYGAQFEAVSIRVPDRYGRFIALMRPFARRVEDLRAAVSAIWRGGPLIFGAFALTYALWALAEVAVTRGVAAIIGAHEADFWQAVWPFVLVGVAAIAEPIRVAIVATACDAVLARNASPHMPDAPIAVSVSDARVAEGESDRDDEAYDAVVNRHVIPEIPGDIGGKQENGQDGVAR